MLYEKSFFKPKQKLTAAAMNKLEDTCYLSSLLLSAMLPETELLPKTEFELPDVAEGMGSISLPKYSLNENFDVQSTLYLITYDGIPYIVRGMFVENDMLEVFGTLGINTETVGNCYLFLDQIDVVLVQGANTSSSRRAIHILGAAGKHTLAISKLDQPMVMTQLPSFSLTSIENGGQILVPNYNNSYTINPDFFKQDRTVLIDNLLFSTAQCDLSYVDMVNYYIDISKEYYFFKCWRAISENTKLDGVRWTSEFKFTELGFMALRLTESTRQEMNLPMSPYTSDAGNTYWYFMCL